MSTAAEKFIGELQAWPEFAGAAADPQYHDLLPRLMRIFAVLERTAARDPEVAMVLTAVAAICNSRDSVREKCFSLAELFDRERRALDRARTMN